RIYPSVAADHEEINVVLEARHGRDLRSGRDGEVVAEIGVGEPEPAVEPATALVPEGRVDRAVAAADEEVDVVLEPAQRGHGRARRDREVITEIGVGEPEPAVEPATALVPESRVDRSVAAADEEVDVVLEAAQLGHGRARRDREVVAEIGVGKPEPAVEPATALVPESRVDRSVAA